MRVALAVVLAVAAGCRGTDEAHCLLDDLEPGLQVASVEVTTTTGRDGTDSDVFLDLEVRGGADQGLYLDDVSSDDFEAFTTDTFVVGVSSFPVEDLEGMQIRKESSLFEAGDWTLDALTIVFLDEDGASHVVYDNPDRVEHMTGDE